MKMPLSRVEKYKKRKKERYFFYFQKGQIVPTYILKRTLIVSGLTVAVFTSSTIAFADTGLSQYLQKWYLEKLVSVEENLTNSVLTETENQKAQLLKNVREQTENSIKELQEYATKQEMEINKKVKEKMGEASKVIEDENQVDLNQSKKLLDQQAENKATNQESKNIETGPEKKDQHVKDETTNQNINTTEIKTGQEEIKKP
ncbi:hypothetical protein [Neobacillus niacini]|uniref:hypothetical protein n=1 Tax=Neobacillus niacini TaxID=86668 RepID=UPI0039830277